MNVVYCSDSSIESFALTLESIYTKEKTILILSCANTYTKIDLDPILQQYENNILGAIFPEIIYKAEVKTKGVIFIILDDLMEIIQINNIHSKKNIDSILEKTDISHIHSCFVFADSLSKKIDLLMESLNEQYGSNISYLGAGSGNLNAGLSNAYCIMTHLGFFKNCAVLGLSRLRSSTACEHGWHTISEPLSVTNSKENVLLGIDYQEPYNVYQKTIKQTYAGLQKHFEFENISKNFPIGISKINHDTIIVRDPILTKDGSLICIGNIPKYSTIYILYGNHNSIIQATKNASLKSFENCDFQSELTFYFAGVSRAYMGEQTTLQDLDSIVENKEFIIGALCLGEIANNTNKAVYFHNRTTIIAKVETK